MSRYRLDHLWIVALLGLIAVAAITSYCRVSPAPDVTDPVAGYTPTVLVLPTVPQPALTLTPTPAAPEERLQWQTPTTREPAGTPVPTAAPTVAPTQTPIPERSPIQRG